MSMTKEVSKDFAECLRYVCNCNCYKSRIKICENSLCLAIVTVENPMFVFVRFLESCDYGDFRGYKQKDLLQEAKEIWKTREVICLKDKTHVSPIVDGKRIVAIKGDYAILFKDYILPTIQPFKQEGGQDENAYAKET